MGWEFVSIVVCPDIKTILLTFMNTVMRLDVDFVVLEGWHTFCEYREDMPLLDRMVHCQICTQRPARQYFLISTEWRGWGFFPQHARLLMSPASARYILMESPRLLKEPSAIYYPPKPVHSVKCTDSWSVGHVPRTRH